MPIKLGEGVRQTQGAIETGGSKRTVITGEPKATRLANQGVEIVSLGDFPEVSSLKGDHTSRKQGPSSGISGCGCQCSTRFVSGSCCK